MTTHIASASTPLIEKYHKLLALDTGEFSEAKLQQHNETLHQLSVQITTLDTLKLRLVNEKIITETQHLNGAIDKLTNTTINDDTYSALINVVHQSLAILESLLPAAL
jgi:hypothetical protein